MTDNAVLPEWLVDVLRCPVTGSRLREVLQDDGALLLVTQDAERRSYRVEGGVPVLLPKG